MAYVMETVKQSEQNFLRLLKEGLQNQYINGVATNVYNNFLEEMESYRRLQSKKEEKLQHGLFNQDVMYIHQSLSNIVNNYNENNPHYQISIFDVNSLLGTAISRPYLTLDKILPMNSQMLPKLEEDKEIKFKQYKIPLKEKTEQPKENEQLLQYA